MADGMGKLNEAFQNYSEFLNLTKRNSDKKETHFLIAEVSRKLGRRTLAIENYERYLAIGNVDDSRLADVLHHLSELHKDGSPDSEKYKSRIQALYRRTKNPMAARLAADLKIVELKKSIAEYKSIRLPSDPNAQKKAVENKIEALNRINKEINSIVQMNSSSAIVSSLYYLGDSNLHMAKAITGAPLPKGLNPQETEMYKDGIKKLAEPFQQKGLESFKLSVERGQELEAYNSEYDKSFEIMSETNKKTYYLNDQKIFESRLVKWSVP